MQEDSDRGLEEGKISVWDMLTYKCLRDAQMEILAGQLYKLIQSLQEIPIDLGGISAWAITEVVGLY